MVSMEQIAPWSLFALGSAPALSDGGAAHKGAGRVSLGCRERKALTLPMKACGL